MFDAIALGQTLDSIPEPGCELAGKVATYVANWRSSDGWVRALVAFTTGTVYAATGNALGAAWQFGSVLHHMARAERIAEAAAASIVNDLKTSGLLAGAIATQNGDQRIHLIGHSRGAAVNARVATLLAEDRYKVDQYTSLDGYSNDWPHGSWILSDIKIVDELAAIGDNVRRKVNYRVESGLNDVIFDFVSQFIQAYSQSILGRTVLPIGPAALGLLALKLIDWRAPVRDDFENYLLEGTLSVGQPSAHFSTPMHKGATELYASSANRLPLRLRYILDNYAGSKSGKEFERPVPQSDGGKGKDPPVGAAVVSEMSNFVDGSFDELGELLQNRPEFVSTGDAALDAWVQISTLPSELLKSMWDIAGSVAAKTENGNAYAELRQDSVVAPSIGQLLLLDADVDRLEFDLTVAGHGENDSLDIIFEDSGKEQVLERLELSKLAPSGRYEVALGEFAGRHGRVFVRLSGPAADPAIVAIDNLGVFTVEVAGDYNDNGIVDAADYTVWRDTLGSTSDLRADGSENGVVDEADYDVWKDHFGETGGTMKSGPTATDDQVFTSVGLPVTIRVLANDSAPGGALVPGSVAVAQPPAHGTVTLVPASGEIVYRPNAGFSGDDPFSYTVKDNQGNESNVGTVVVSVLPFNSLLGDLNGDGNLSQDDLDAFDVYDFNPAVFANDYPGVDAVAVGDLNSDGALNLQDRPLLEQLLTSKYRPDRFEPNDSFERAENLGTVDAKSETELTVHLPGNEDYFQFVAAKTGATQIKALFSHAEGDVGLFVYDVARQEIGRSESVDDDESVTLDLQTGQRYFVRVAPKPGVTQPRYDLVIADTVAPSILAIDPANQAVRPAGLENVGVDFSEPIQTASATNTVFQLKNLANGTAVPISVQQADGGRRVVLSFAPLAAGDYELRIDAAQIRDLSGTPLGQQPIVSRFTTVAATIQWKGPAGGSWHTPSNWVQNRVPGPGDDVLIEVPGDVTITFNQGSTTIKSLYSANSFQLTGGTLGVSTFVQVDEKFKLGGGGTLVGATIRPGASGAQAELIDSNAVFDSVTLDGDLLVEHQATLTIRNGLTVNGRLTVRKRAGDKKPEPFSDTRIVLEGDQELGGNGEVFMDGAVGWSRVTIRQTSGTALSIDPALTIRGKGYGLYAHGSLTNNGTILFDGGWNDNELNATAISNGGVLGSDVGGGILLLRAPQITNSGAIETRGPGQLSFDTLGLSNTGRIDARGGGRISINAGQLWTSSGTIRAVENSELHMHGAYKLAGTSFDGRGGKIISYGDWDNRNATHVLNSATGSLHVGGGTIFRGRFAGSDGEGLIVEGASTVFDGVTVDSSLRLHNSTLNVQNGLTLNGTATLVRDGHFAARALMLFHAGSALLGTGEVVSIGGAEPVGPNRLNQYGNTLKPAAGSSELRIGPGITIRGSLLIGEAANPSRVINEGTIAGTQIVQIWASEFENAGIVEISGPGILAPLSDLTINRGQFVARNGGELQLFNTIRWQPNAHLDNDGGKVYLLGDVDIKDAPLRFTGDIILRGKIREGTIPATTGVVIVENGTLDNVQVDADLRLHNSTLNLQNSLTLNGTATLVRTGHFTARALILFHTGSRLLGTGEVVSEGAAEPVGPNRNNQYGNTIKPAAGSSELRIGPGITIRGSLLVGEAANPSRVVNEGTIAGTQIVQIWASEFENAGSVEISGAGSLASLSDLTINRGQFVARNGGEMQLFNAIRWEPNAKLDSEGGKIYLFGEVDITRAPLNFTGDVILRGTIRGGTIPATSGLLIVQGGTLDAVRLDGNARVQSSTLTARNGLTLNGRASLVSSTLLFHAGSALLGTGEVVLTGPNSLDRDGRIVSGNILKPASGSSELRIGPGITLRGGFLIGDSTNPSRVINEGTIIGPARTDDLSLSFLQISASEFENLGTVRVLAPSVQGVVPDIVVFADLTTNRGSLVAAGGELELYGLTENEGEIAAIEGGRVSVFQPSDFSAGALQDGTWRVGPNSTMRLYGANIVTLGGKVMLEATTSQLTTGNNSVFALAGLATIAEGGELSLLGGRDFSTVAALQNAGRLALGAGSIVTVNGAYTQAATGTLSTSLGDAGNATRVAATSTASIAGTLAVAPAPGFIPQPGSTFEVLTAIAVSGRLSQLHSIGFNPRLQVDAVYGANNVTVWTYRAGDADHDGDVDGEDYEIWKDNFGSIGNHNADFNGNGIVDAADFTVWRDNLDAPPAPAPSVARRAIAQANRKGPVETANRSNPVSVERWADWLARRRASNSRRQHVDEVFGRLGENYEQWVLVGN